MSIKLLPCCTRRVAAATVNRTLTCILNNSYSCYVNRIKLNNLGFVQKFTRLGRVWGFPRIVVPTENTTSYKPIGNLQFLFTSSGMESFQADKKRFIEMPAEKKRQQYQCGSKFTELSRIPTWPQFYRSTKGADKEAEPPSSRAELSNKVSMWEGDITSLEIDGIVNAANRSLLGGGGVDGAIHRAAGPSLLTECKTLLGCETGEAKVTGGYRLPAKYVIHTVGPQGEYSDKLRNCYKNCLQAMKNHGLRSIAFPCISTGVYGYPNEAAAHVALETTKQWLSEGSNKESVDRIIFCLFMPDDIQIYKRLLKDYFPPN